MLPKNFLEDGQAQKQDALWGCGISIHRDKQNLTDMILCNQHEVPAPAFNREERTRNLHKSELLLQLGARLCWNEKSSMNQSVPSYSSIEVSRLSRRARHAPFLEALRNNSFCTEREGGIRNTQQRCHPLTNTLQKFSVPGTCLAASIRWVSLLLSLKASSEGNEITLSAIFWRLVP